MDRIRRVKCDESKPECRRCTSTGRKCDGYVSFEAFVPSDRKASDDGTHKNEEKSLIATSVATSLRPGNQLTHLETRSFEYFRRRSLYALSGFIETEFWSQFLLQVSEAEPAVKHAIIALSNFHERTEPKYLSLAEDSSQALSPERQHDFALQQYNKAIRLLRSRLSQNDQTKNVTLTSCILFTCMEFMRGNPDAATTHLRSGLNILRLQPPDSDQGHDPVGGPRLDHSLAPIFARLALIHSLHGQPRNNRFWDLMDVPEESLPSQFKTLDGARISLMNLVNAVLAFNDMLEFNLFDSESTIINNQKKLMQRLENWSSAFEHFTLNQPSDLHVDQRGVKVVWSHYLLSSLWVQKALSPAEEAFDAHIPTFIKIISTLESVIQDSATLNGGINDLPSFSVDMGFISVLFFTATKCRDPLARRKAAALLRQGPRREGLWDSIEAAKVADLIISVEEESVQNMPGVLPPEWARIHDCDIQPPDPVRKTQLVNLTWKPRGLDCDAFDIRPEHITLDHAEEPERREMSPSLDIPYEKAEQQAQG